MSEECFRASSTEETGEGFDCSVARLCDGVITGNSSYYHSAYSGEQQTELVWIELTFPKVMNSFSIELYSRDKTTSNNSFWLTPTTIYMSNLNEPFESEDNSLHPAMDNITVSPKDMNSWNTKNTELRILGIYTNTYDKAGNLFYSLDGTPPTSISELLNPGDSIDITIPVTFTENRDKHTLQIYSLDENGNKLSNNLYSYYDITKFTVTGLQDFEYTGSPITIDSLVIATADSTAIENGIHYNNTYANNTNAGTASIFIEGVYPYSVGEITYYYEIERAQLTGEIIVSDTILTYNGQGQQPDFVYIDERFDNLSSGSDYQYWYNNNVYAGEGKIIVNGIGNFKGQIEAKFNINKAVLPQSKISLDYEEDITYDGNTHPATVDIAEYGIGEISVHYTDSNGNIITEAPSSIGEYSISIELSEGSCYLSNKFENIGKFCIYEFDESEWNTLVNIYTSYDNGSEWINKWDLTQGKEKVSQLYGITIKKGHITEVDLSNNNITGKFPYPILLFSQLKSLNLAHNNIYGDIGNDLSNCIAENTDKQIYIENLIINNNNLEGNVGEFARYMTELITLDISNNGISEVYPVISAKVEDLNLSGQNINTPIELNMTSLNNENFISEIPTILLYDHIQQNHAQNMSLTIEESNWNALFEYSDNTVSLYEIDKNIFTGESGDTLNATLNSGIAANSNIGIIFKFNKGDVDFNTLVNILDMQAVINFSFAQDSETLFNYTAANVYKDTRINVQDVVSLINILLSQEYSATAMNINGRRGLNINETQSAFLYISNKKLILSSPIEVAAADITFSGGNGINWKLPYGLTNVSNTKNEMERCIIYSMSGTTIPAGETVIAEFDGEIPTIQDVILSDKNAQEIKAGIGINNNTTGIYSEFINNKELCLKQKSLFINTDEDLYNVQWKIYDTVGNIIALGEESYVPSGSYILADKLPLSANCIYLIRATIAGESTIELKTMNNK